MTIQGDRTTKVLLTFIAIFLGFLVFKSIFNSAPRAVAQTGQSDVNVQNYTSQQFHNGDNGQIVTYRTIPVSTIKFNTKDKLLSLNVIDSASAFLLQYTDRIEVFRIDGINLTAIQQMQQAAQNAANR